MNDGLRYRLRMMGNSVERSTNVYCDNNAVGISAIMIESTLKKKYISVYLHKIRNCYSKGVVQITYEPTETNLADVCTKVLPAAGEKNRRHFLLIDIKVNNIQHSWIGGSVSNTFVISSEKRSIAVVIRQGRTLIIRCLSCRD